MVKCNDLKLQPCCDIGSAEALSEELEGNLISNADLTVDASQVEKIDTSSLQLLISASISFAKKDSQLSIVNPSPAFIAAADLLDLSKYLYLKK